MIGCVVQVWFEHPSEGKGQPGRFHIIETEFDDFAGFCEAVEADRLIGGATLITRRMPHGYNLVVDRRPCAFRSSAVLRCALPNWRFVEEENA